MRVVVQRVSESNVVIDNKTQGEIKNGLMVLVGFTQGDTTLDIDYIVNKIVNLRIFDDENGVMNKSVLDINGSILSISQFTLYADARKGNRPSYINALPGGEATILYDTFNQKLREFLPLECGIFGADMKVSLINEGPVTIIIDSKEK